MYRDTLTHRETHTEAYSHTNPHKYTHIDTHNVLDVIPPYSYSSQTYYIQFWLNIVKN
jgi:hypothetical protein